MQVTKQHLGGPVKTYARRKGRYRVLQTSTPLKATDGEDLSLVEMTRRMKKRARQSINSTSPRPDYEQSLNRSQKLLKRRKNTHAVTATLPSDPGICSTSAFPLDLSTSLNDGTNNLQYQTPFNLSPACSPTAPDSMSPVPPRRHLPGTDSRNLKENKSVKRLASPFHSRSVSQACSRACSRTNSPKKSPKKPPFYIKTRTRSEANAHPGEHLSNEGLFPISGSLPTFGSMKTAFCGPHLDDSSTAHMLQNLSGQDWLRPAKALSRTPFPEDYVPPGTPFQELVLSSETFLEGVPLQTSTPNVVKNRLREHMSIKATPSAPNTPDFSHSPDSANNNLISSFNESGLGSHRRTQRHSNPNRDNTSSSLDPPTMSATSTGCMDTEITLKSPPVFPTAAYPPDSAPHSNHDSIFSSSFDAFTMSPTSIFWSGCMNTESTLKSDPVFPAAEYPSDSAQAVVNLSGMLDDLDIDGMKICSLSPVQRSRSLDSAQSTTVASSPSGAPQIAGRRRDRASTIRASDYMAIPVMSVPGVGEPSTAVTASTTRTRSGTIRAIRHPVTSSASTLPVAVPQTCVRQRQTQSGTSYDALTIVSADKALQELDAMKSMVVDVHDDESDDELLLDPKGWNWDGRWD